MLLLQEEGMSWTWLACLSCCLLLGGWSPVEVEGNAGSQPGPELELRPSPEAELHPSPEPTLRPSTEPDLRLSPEPELQSSPEPELQPSTKPEVQPSPDPELLRPSPEPELRPSPEPDLQLTPEPEILQPSLEPEVQLEEEEPDQEGVDWAELGSGGSLLLQDLLHSFPADSPFVTEVPGGKPVNCSQRYWLPSATPVCWDHIAGPEEFERSRLLVLQNRASLQAVSQSSEVVVEVGVGMATYNQQAQEDLRGVHADHLNVSETTEVMQKVFLAQEEKRREGKEHYAFTSIKERIANTRDSIIGKDHKTSLLERQFTSLEKSLHTMQHRLNKLMMQ